MTVSHHRPLRSAVPTGSLPASGEVLSPANAQDKAAMPTVIRDFSFAAHAPDFDQHIRDSIRGLDCLHADCVDLSRYFVQSGTMVVDIGCSTGMLLRRTRDANEPNRPLVSYIGIDIEPKFGEHWQERGTDNVRFQVCDARSFEFENASLVISLFTLQFISLRDRVSLLRRVHDGLVEGGALIIAEKVLANDARFQDIGTFTYYDHKGRSGFSPKDILDKERSLRGQMVPWEEARWEDALSQAGFEFQRFWQNHLFVAWVARKGAPRRSGGITPLRRRIERPKDRALVTNPGTMIHPSSEIIFIQDPAVVPLLSARKSRTLRG
jgi:tRNA (cmo5U34)-methyltransferase